MPLFFIVLSKLEKLVSNGVLSSFAKASLSWAFQKKHIIASNQQNRTLRIKSKAKMLWFFHQPASETSVDFCAPRIRFRATKTIQALTRSQRIKILQCGRYDYFYPIERRSKLRFTCCTSRSRAFFQPCFPNLVHNVEIHHIGKPDCCR